MALMNDDNLDLVSGGRRSDYRDPASLKSSTMPVGDCQVFTEYDQFIGNHDCINCVFYDYHNSKKCVNSRGIRYGK